MVNLKQKVNHYLKQEIIRNKLAKEKRLEDLKKTYYLKNIYNLNPNTKKFWDEEIDKSGKITDEVTNKRINIVYKMIPNNAKSMLDIGIGYGYLESLLDKKKKNIEITGLDISQRAIKDLKKRFNYKLFISNAEIFPKKLGKFDLVVAMEIFEHILPQKIFKVLSNIKNVMQDKGVLIATVPLLANNPDIRMKFPYDSSNHIRFYSKELIIAELMIAGFEINEIKEIYAFPNFNKFRIAVNSILKKWSPNILIVKASIK